MLESFLYPFIQRVLSGVQNMYGYGKETIAFTIVGVILAAFPLMLFTTWWVFLLYMLCNVFVVYMKTSSFKLHPKMTLFKKFQDIHLWENFVTGGLVLYMILAGFNILMIMCTVYPALILHKGFINIGSGLNFFASATDDATGKTYGIPVLGIKIKRSSTTMRLIFAGLSIVAAILIAVYGWNVSI